MQRKYKGLKEVLNKYFIYLFICLFMCLSLYYYFYLFILFCEHMNIAKITVHDMGLGTEKWLLVVVDGFHRKWVAWSFISFQW